jgi:hypothetical protein
MIDAGASDLAFLGDPVLWRFERARATKPNEDTELIVYRVAPSLMRLAQYEAARPIWMARLHLNEGDILRGPRMSSSEKFSGSGTAGMPRFANSAHTYSSPAYPPSFLSTAAFSCLSVLCLSLTRHHSSPLWSRPSPLPRWQGADGDLTFRDFLKAHM